MAPGFTEDDYDPIEVWPEHQLAFRIFTLARSQWRHGFAGPTGLDNAAVYPLIDRFAEGPEHWLELLEDVQVMEAAALGAIAARTNH